MHVEMIETQVFEAIQKQIGVFQAPIAIILGSGMTDMANELDNATTLSYSVLPNFSSIDIEGHAGNFVYGDIQGQPIVFLQGRPHWYEGRSAEAFHIFIQAIRAFGCHSVIMTNAAGALNASIPVGSVVSIRDHINLQFKSPLMNMTGCNKSFLGLEDIYDATIRQRLQELANQQSIALHDGVYMSTIGPCFETPAEVKAFRMLGGDVVGMSTVPEVITAKYYGLKVAVLSMVTNLAAGCGDQHLSHALTLARAASAGQDLRRLLRAYIVSHSDVMENHA